MVRDALAARVTLAAHPVRGRFHTRRNRFLVDVEVGGQREKAHLPNPGRLEELLIPGYEVILNPRPLPNRKTAYDLVAVRLPEGTVVSVDSRLPNRLVHVALRARAIPEVLPFQSFEAETPLGTSRIDFLLRGPRADITYVEVKSCTLVEAGAAMFPDAPTERGRRHLEVLAEVVRDGAHAAILFVIQRDDAQFFRPRDETDPRFGMALRAAAEAGVRTLAYNCNVSRRDVGLAAPIPVRL